MTSSSNTPRVLVIRLGAMGDLVHAGSAVQRLKRQHPDIQVDWLTSPLYTSLLEAFQCDGMPLIHQVLAYQKKDGLSGLLKSLSSIRKHSYDAIINLQPSLKTHILSLGSGAKHIANYKKEKLSVFGEEQRNLSRKHAADNFLEPFITLFPDISSQPITETPTISLPNVHSITQKPFIGLIIGVGQKRGNRGWALESYQTLIQKLLADTALDIVLIGGPEEVESGSILEQKFPQESRLHNTCGKQSLLETASLLSQARLVIGGDTGPLHLASCFPVPIISIFAPTSVQRTGAIGPEAIRPHILPQQSLTCWPCEQPSCPLTGADHLACMQQITPEQVFHQALPFLPQ